jgi:ammonium transporter Rh
MAMLLVGFGFLMVFVRKYGRSALTATFLLVSVGIPSYILIKSLGFFGGHGAEIDTLILAEFATASLLITSGAILGRIKMYQYIILGILFIPAYMLNEWIMLDGGLGLVTKGGFVDTGGSIVIHAFGALFGIAAAISLTTKNEMSISIDTDFTSDRFSLLGSMLLWVFWPSFCAALVPPELVVHTGINVILALSGATVATHITTIMLRGKIDPADIANASLAGGVAIGSVSDTASFEAAIIIGLIAGILSVFGFAVIQNKLQKGLKIIDTCGVSNLHGMPGIFGGLAALVIVPHLNMGAQLTGIGLTIIIALIAGWLTGLIVSLFGHRNQPYQDIEEFSVDD